MHDPLDHGGRPPATAGEVRESAAAGDEALSDNSRWLAALAYLFVLAIFVLYEAKQRPQDGYVRFHARQGFVLFFAEFSLLIVSMILGHTVGRVEYLGIVIMTTYNLCVGLLAVGVSVMGFANALAGERWQLPVLGVYAKRVPLS